MVMGRIRLSMDEGGLKLESEPESDILKGEHRIFLSNVLGLERSEQYGGYITSGSGALESLKEVIEYLREKSIEFELNPAAQRFVDNLDAEKRELAHSIVEGRRLKRRWVRAINVPGLKRQLKAYQIPSVAHMVAVGNGANFSVPGSGKTSITLSAFEVLKKSGKVEKLIVVGPRASFMPWEDEYKACFGRKADVIRMVGSPDERSRLYRIADDHEMVLLTFQLAYNDADELASYLRRHPTMLVLDESHNIKKIEGGKWADALLQIAPYASRRVVLSGTPIPNRLEDIWSQITFLWPDKAILGDREAFKRRIEKAGEHGPRELREAVFPLYWRIRKSDLRLPRPRFHRIIVPMRRYQQAIYDALAAKTLSEVVNAPEDQVKLRIWRRARMIRLLQAASNPTLLHEFSMEFKIPPLDATGLSIEKVIERYSEFETPAKLEATVDLVHQLVGKGKKVLVWSAFVHNIETLKVLLHDDRPAVIHGDVPKDEDEDASYNREQIIRDFKDTDRYKVLVANPCACAESISLQKACMHAIYLDRTFNAAHYMQSQDRIHRIGLGPRDNVHYYLFESRGTIDEVIDSRLERKIEVMKEVLAEDFAALNLDLSEGEFTEETEADKDFDAVLSDLHKRYSG